MTKSGRSCSGAGAAALPLALALTLSVGCGGGDVEKLEGVWGFGDDVNAGCLMEYVFEDGNFSESTYCRLTNGHLGVELAQGSYRQRADAITFTLLRSTCPDAVRIDVTQQYEISRSRLTLSTEDGALGLTKRRVPAVLDGTRVNGCFEAGNMFRSSPLRDL